MNKPIKPIGLADVRSLIVGGDGYLDTNGVGLAMALDAMTAASRDLFVATDALYHDDVDTDALQSLIIRVAWQLQKTADICWRVAGDEARSQSAAAGLEAPEGEAAE